MRLNFIRFILLAGFVIGISLADTGRFVLAQDAEDSPEQVELELRVFHLEHLTPQAASEYIEDLFREDLEHAGGKLVADQRTGSLILRAPDSLQKSVEALLMRLDSPEPRSLPEKELSDRSDDDDEDIERPRTPQRDRETRRVSPSPDVVRLERQALKLAGSCREMAAAPEADAPRLEQLKRELEDVVRAAFRARIDWQRNQIIELRQRLDRLEKNIEVRSRRSGEIVKRRVADLLDPEQAWESEADLAQGLATRMALPPGSEAIRDGAGDVAASEQPGEAPVRADRKSDALPADAGFRPADAVANPLHELIAAETAAEVAQESFNAATADVEAAKQALLVADAAFQAGQLPVVKYQEAQTRMQRTVAAMKRAEIERQGKRRVLQLAKQNLTTQHKLAVIDLQQAKVRLEDAETVRNRSTELLQKQVISQEEYSRSNIAFRHAQLELDRARARLDFYQQTLLDHQALLEGTGGEPSDSEENK